jgi:antitoxin component YwqK of YwqJK toxin-antitoxin module
MNTVNAVAQDNEIYQVVEKMPAFIGDLDKAKENVANSIPCLEIGSIYYFRMLIEKDGSISEVKLLKGIAKNTAECNNAITVAFTRMPKWQPGMQNGNIVRVYLNTSFKKTRNELPINTSNNEVKPNLITVNEDENSELFQDGTIKSKGKLVNGKKNGEWLTFFKSGKIQNKTMYVNDEISGEVINYFLSGGIQEKYFIQNGKREGKHEKYYANGKLNSVVNYKNGVSVGSVITYDESGNKK